MVALSACAVASAEDDRFTQAQADAITGKCRAAREMLKVEDGYVTMIPGAEGDYEIATCVLKEIRATGTTKFGFVGNGNGSEPQEPHQQMTPEQAAEIEALCELPVGALTGSTPIADIREAGPKIACALAEAQKRNLAVGFISNPVDPNAQTH
jgi:hypothetical protein